MSDVGPRRTDTRKAVEIVYGEPEAQLRSNMRLAMRNAKFETIIELDRTDKVRAFLGSRSPDLVILDGGLKGGAVSRLISDVRHGRLGRNPFIPFIVTLWSPTAELVHETANSGADDMLVKPVSPQRLVDRIGVLTDNRKPFIVTADYIGPDRRKDPDRGSEIPKFDVPNSLKAKIEGERVESARFDSMISAARKKIDGQRLKRNAFQLCFLTELVLPMLQSRRGAQNDVLETLQAIDKVGRDTAARLSDSRYAHLGGVCRNLIDVAGRLLDDPEDPLHKDVELLKPLTDAILAGLNPSADAAEMAGEIDAALENYKKRQMTRGGR